MNKIALLIIIGLLVVGGIFAFNQKKPVMEQKSTTETTTSSVKEFTMTAEKWIFTPSLITVKQGDKVKLTIKSVDVTHGFALPDFGVKVDLVPDKEETVEFTADKKGEFTFFCSVMCGEGHMDMKGKLVVE